MIKSFTFSLLSILLVVSILAPSIETMCKSSYDNILLMDFNEEENSNQETEKKFEEKDLFFSSIPEKGNFYFTKEITKSQTSLLPYSDFFYDIKLPPPKKLV